MPINKKLESPDSIIFPLVVAHRGFSDEAPENSLAAFRKAIDAEADMIELDVRLSADDIPVIFHDKRLQRTSNARGQLNAKTAEQLLLVDNGSWFSPKFHRERIPLLSDIFPLLKQNISFNIEIKPDVVTKNGTSAVETIIHEVKKAKVLSRVMFTSFNHSIIKEIHEIDDSITTGVIYNPITHFRKSPSKLITSAGAKYFVCSKYQMNADVANDTHNAGLKFFVYGVETGRDVQRMLNLDVDGIICNNPKFVRETLELLRK